eukprot:TRINITY_DN3355_c0_g1_i2.p1 TRINITY_DN3355_c0_g1~~TRINITY_DN3355_c0_g1_i2.p1  ORF type:complete len:124 (-),score=13.50 TRINITY_DN3355_c0_g1_i2:7-378(-)
MSLNLDPSDYDINLSSDKRLVLIRNEEEIVQMIKKFLEEHYPRSRNTTSPGTRDQADQTRRPSPSHNLSTDDTVTVPHLDLDQDIDNADTDDESQSVKQTGMRNAAEVYNDCLLYTSPSPRDS